MMWVTAPRGHKAKAFCHSGLAQTRPPVGKSGAGPPGQQVAPVPVGLHPWPPPLPLLSSYLRAEESECGGGGGILGTPRLQAGLTLAHFLGTDVFLGGAQPNWAGKGGGRCGGEVGGKEGWPAGERGPAEGLGPQTMEWGQS